MSQEAEYRVVPLADISISPLNPRKYFSDESIKELAESIKYIGVIEPIITRNTAKGLELVSGERRFRSSIVAGKETIPALIRNLSDDEAFEIMIIENLQRKDVHPLDEAEAFQKMLDTGRYQMEDIAAKVAKPVSFVVQRLKLNDLCAEMAYDFYQGVMSVGHAVLLCRLPKEQQLEIMTSYKDKDTIDGYGTVNQLKKEVEHQVLELDQAVFSLTEEFNFAPACSACPKRTSVNPVLFPDMQQADSCTDKICFRGKTDAHLESEVREIINLGKDIILGCGHGAKAPDSVQALAKKFGYDLKVEFEDFYPTEKPNAFQKAVLYVSGQKKGQLGKVWVRKQEAAAATSGFAPVASATISERQKILDKEKKFEELDDQKVFGQILEELKKKFARKTEQPFTFSQRFTRTMLLYMALANSDMWQMLQDLNAYGYDLNFDNKGLDEVVDQLMKLSFPQQEQLLALALFKKFSGNATASNIHGQIIRELALAHPGISVREIEEAQKAAAGARKKKVEEDLQKLEKPKKLKGLTALLNDPEPADSFKVDFDGVKDVKDIPVSAQQVNPKSK